MDLFEELNREIALLNFPILSTDKTNIFPNINNSLLSPSYEGFLKSPLKFDEEYFKINEFKVLTASTIYIRYINYTNEIITKSFLGFKYNLTQSISDLDEIEDLIKNIKYDLSFVGGLHARFSWVSFFILKDDKNLEIDRKSYLEIIRKLKKTKNTHFCKNLNNRIKKLIK